MLGLVELTQCWWWVDYLGKHSIFKICAYIAYTECTTEVRSSQSKMIHQENGFVILMVFQKQDGPHHLRIYEYQTPCHELRSISSNSLNLYVCNLRSNQSPRIHYGPMLESSEDSADAPYERVILIYPHIIGTKIQGGEKGVEIHWYNRDRFSVGQERGGFCCFCEVYGKGLSSVIMSVCSLFLL